MAARIVNAAQAPWAVLLAPNLPLGALCGWGLRDMLKLRCVCVALRGGMTTAAFFTAILRSLGVRGQFERLSGAHAFLLCERICSEVFFVHRLHSICEKAGAGCTFAGSHALHRMLLLDEAGCRGEEPPDWGPGDMDVFVSGTRDTDLRTDAEPWGPPRNDALEASIAAARDFMQALYPGAKIEIDARDAYRMSWMREEPVNWQEPDDTTAYDREEVLQTLAARDPYYVCDDDQRVATWLPFLEAQLPERGGFHRPHQLGRIVEVKVGRIPLDKTERKYQDPWRVALSELGDVARTGWRAFHSVNIVELVSERPIDTLAVVGGFDMVQCGVAMEPAAPARLSFAYSQETLSCVRRRELRFTRYVLGPLRQVERDGEMITREQSLRNVVLGLFHRGRTYEQRGFALMQQDGSRLAVPRISAKVASRHVLGSSVERLSGAYLELPLLAQLVLAFFQQGDGGARPLKDIVWAMSPVLLPLGQQHSTAAASFSTDELALSIANLLRSGLLVALDVGEGEIDLRGRLVERRSEPDGFPLVMSTEWLMTFGNRRAQASDWHGGPYHFTTLTDELLSELLAAVDAFPVGAAPEEVIPEAIEHLPILVEACQWSLPGHSLTWAICPHEGHPGRMGHADRTGHPDNLTNGVLRSMLDMQKEVGRLKAELAARK